MTAMWSANTHIPSHMTAIWSILTCSKVMFGNSSGSNSSSPGSKWDARRFSPRVSKTPQYFSTFQWNAAKSLHNLCIGLESCDWTFKKILEYMYKKLTRQHVKAWTKFTCKCNQKPRSVILHTLGRGSSGMEYFHIAAGRFPTGMACLLRIWSIYSLMYCSVAAVCLKQHPLISTPSFAYEYHNIVRWYHVMSLHCHVVWWLLMLGVKGHII